MVKGYQLDVSSRSMVTVATRALCNHGIIALFGISNLVGVSETDPSSPKLQEREGR